MQDVRRNVCRQRRGLALAGTTLYAAEYFSDSVAAVELAAGAARRVISIPLGSRPRLPEARRGEMLFHDAGLCFQRWQSCSSCHPDGRADGLNWDLLNDGLSTPENTKSLVWSQRTPPAMSLGVRATARAAVRTGLRHILFAVRPEAEAAALDAHLESLELLPSPHRTGDDRDARIRRGRRLYENAGCLECHTPPL